MKTFAYGVVLAALVIFAVWLDERAVPAGVYAGQVIAATTQLADNPHFAGTRIYIASHDRRGAFGIILNRGEDGGPLGKDREFWLALSPQGAVSVVPASSLEKGIRAYRRVGYAGWSRGQLDREFARGDWQIVKTPVETLLLR
jgi:putative AlgH/UPF0301 family transcriptional regulator